jgi:hypothetical protein
MTTARTFYSPHQYPAPREVGEDHFRAIRGPALPARFTTGAGAQAR